MVASSPLYLCQLHGRYTFDFSMHLRLSYALLTGLFLSGNQVVHTSLSIFRLCWVHLRWNALTYFYRCCTSPTLIILGGRCAHTSFTVHSNYKFSIVTPGSPGIAPSITLPVKTISTSLPVITFLPLVEPLLKDIISISAI